MNFDNIDSAHSVLDGIVDIAQMMRSFCTCESDLVIAGSDCKTTKGRIVPKGTTMLCLRIDWQSSAIVDWKGYARVIHPEWGPVDVEMLTIWPAFRRPRRFRKINEAIFLVILFGLSLAWIAAAAFLNLSLGSSQIPDEKITKILTKLEDQCMSRIWHARRTFLLRA